MKKKLTTLACLLFAFCVPIFPATDEYSLTNTIRDLHIELQQDSTHHKKVQQFDSIIAHQHQKLIDVIKKSDKLSLLLYTQEKEMTFDMSYALKKVTSEYQDFSNDRRPYDRIVGRLDFEINRYARLIEALRRLPPQIEDIGAGVVPDSLRYSNDSLNEQTNTPSSLEKEIIRIATAETGTIPFVLDREGKAYRDSCIRDASVLLKLYADKRAFVVTDSMHYQEAYLRMNETYEYARLRYLELEKYVFAEGQIPFLAFFVNKIYFTSYWNKIVTDLNGQYDFKEGFKRHTDWKSLSNNGKKARLVRVCITQFVLLLIFWIAAYLAWRLGVRLFKPRQIKAKQLPLLSILTGTILYFPLFGIFWHDNEYTLLGVNNIRIFLWLLIVISGSLLLRVKPEQLRDGIRAYIPTLAIALVIIFCRNVFVPDKLLNFLFPPVLFLIMLRQLLFCIKDGGKATSVDRTLGWVSLAIYIFAFFLSFFGYTMAALLDLVAWYFQLAVLLSIVCISYLLDQYKERWLNKRLAEKRKHIIHMTGEDTESMLFGVTWFYDFIKQVGIPVLVVLSLPMCIHLSMNIFDFNEMFAQMFNSPIHIGHNADSQRLYITGNNIVNLLIFFFVIRYLNKAFHAIWQHSRYESFMRKHNRTNIRTNEINLSLGNSVISVLVWMTYITAVVVVWRIPTGSLGLIAGGLSAGIGIALKDIINNFIYGIQLMGGRLRVGDWIECDGIRGRVTAINYQCVQVETVDGTEMSFLNSSLFGKNFNNLTRNNSYEFTKIIVGVAYGTDINKVREILVNAMQQLRTKDKYGREIVEPKKGVYVVVNNMSDSSVDIAVKQYVLVAEKIGYVDRAKEVIYNALNEAGITIPFPQCDIHLVREGE
ncbi:MAG: mechanosensitive ion channel [Paludibacteraceae bacterium]|nr:mechanosensitive ion channel [Paludibacteraceae bacterium]